jgi:methionyl-tRNA formyltransferase
MTLVFAGTPEFAATSLQALLGAGHQIALVLTQPDRKAGRGLKPHPPAVKRLAEARGLLVVQPAALDDALVAHIRMLRPEAIVVVAYGRLVPAALLEVPPHGCVNVHASLLPRWRGAAPIQRALMAGDASSGITIMQMNAGLDTGPILLQEALPIAPDDTAGTLHDKLATLGGRLIVRALATRVNPQQQDEALATYAPRLRKEEAEIDWSRPASAIERHVRAFNPAPGAQTRIGGSVVKIWHALVERGTTGAPPGTVRVADFSGVVVSCGQDELRITELQRAGGRRLPAGEFLSGFRLAVGARFGTADG